MPGKVRVGYQMARAWSFVGRHDRPCTLIEVARHVAPGASKGSISLGCGYATVHRAIRAGLLIAAPHPTVRGRVVVRAEVVGPAVEALDALGGGASLRAGGAS